MKVITPDYFLSLVQFTERKGDAVTFSPAAEAIGQTVVSGSMQGKYQGRMFAPLFTKSTWSEYRNAASFVTNLSQRSALSKCGDPDVEHLYRDFEEDEGLVLYPQNPCAFNRIFFTGIEIWSDNKKIDLVESNCRESGEVVYKQPGEGAVFGVWTGGLTHPKCHVALLAAIVTGGFHAQSSYSWKNEYGCLADERDPIVYVSCRGNFVCEILTKVGSEEKKVVLSFCVSGSVDEWKVDVPDCVGLPTVEDCGEVCLESNPSTGVPNPENGIADIIVTTSDVICEAGQNGTTEDKVGSSTAGMAILQRAMQELSLVSIEDPQKLLLLNVIGSGAFGTVHRACWRGIIVAAKIIPNVMMSEVEVLRLIHHPHLSCLLGIERLEGDKLAVITPLVRGPNLHDVILGVGLGANHRKMSNKEKLLVCVQVCQAVVFLHTNSPVLAHLDIKPANILIDQLTLHATLTDFGLSKIMTATAQVGTRTMLAGTPGFQPQEQLRAEYVGVECDVYAFGGVLVVVFTERPLWEGLAPYQIMYKVTVGNVVPDTSSLEPAVQALCNSCFLQRKCRPTSSQVLGRLLMINY